MKKTSLFILLILLTFSLSQSNIKIHFQSKQAYIGIREIDKMYDYISQKMNLPKKTKEIIKEELNFLEFCDTQSRSSSDCLSTPNKLREFKINSFSFEGEPLKINKKYALNLVYDCEAIIEKPSKWERKCKSGFLGIGKNCKNVELEIKGRHYPAIIKRVCIVITSLIAIIMCDELSKEYGNKYLK